MRQDPREDDEQHLLETKPFLAHLEDLRWTIIRCVGALAAGITICAFSVRSILLILYVPYIEAGRSPKDLINIGVADPFSIHMSISVLGGVILSLPAMLYFVGQFLLPALMPREKRYLAPVFFGGTVLFIAGVVFCYCFVLKVALSFFLGYSTYLGFEATWTAKELVDFEVQMLIGFGLAFEFPLVLIVLNLLGMVSSRQLATTRRYAAFAIFMAACCIIPSTDPFTLALFSVPLYALYESCVWIAWMLERKREKV